MSSIAVLGDGAMGTTCALLLDRRPGCRVALWSAREENGRLLQAQRENIRLLPGVSIPETIRLTLDVAEALAGVDLLVFAIPTVYLRSTLQRIAPVVRKQTTAVVSTAKGMEQGTFLRPSEVLLECLGPRPVAVLSGPGHAEEISRGLPASLVAASTDLDLALRVQALFHDERLRIYTNADVIGVELAGALKNIVGIAAGICDGLGFGDNAKSALMTRSLAEITRFGIAHGADRETFYGLAGIGDLITTCISAHGRDRRVGELLGRGKRLGEILDGWSQVAEGVATTRSVHQRAVARGLEMPITAEVYRVLYEDKDPLQAVQDLMLRPPKPETL